MKRNEDAAMRPTPFPSTTLRLQTLALLREHIIKQSIMDGKSLDAFIISRLLQAECRKEEGSGFGTRAFAASSER